MRCLRAGAAALAACPRHLSLRPLQNATYSIYLVLQISHIESLSKWRAGLATVVARVRASSLQPSASLPCARR
eukprot:SAG31_NODE_36822_length_310_cov_0.535545_1_plen_72_part_10